MAAAPAEPDACGCSNGIDVLPVPTVVLPLGLIFSFYSESVDYGSGALAGSCLFTYAG